MYFTNGHTPSRAVIEFAINKDTIANHCRVTNCVIKDYNQMQRNNSDLWVLFKGRHNQLDHCFLTGKSNRGPTVRVDLEGNTNINNHHKIINNHFGPRPPKGGPSAETIQIGNSYTSMCPSYTLVANNLFDRCNGEVEIISSKTNFNEFRNNVFYRSEGSLVTRHGNYCIVDGNYFIGSEDSENYGGVRLIGTGHRVTNNYFYNLKGQNFRSPLAVMNGIPKSPLNRYIQVTDVVVAFNSWVNCTSPWQFGIGSNVSQKDVLPASEIRSARPIRTTVANNLIYNSTGDPAPVIAHDLLDGILFKQNIINNQGANFEAIQGLEAIEFNLEKLSDDIWIPTSDFPKREVYPGFEFEQITQDLFGSSRSKNNMIGATLGKPNIMPDLFNQSEYGPNWSHDKRGERENKVHLARPGANLADLIDKAMDGDTIELEAGNYDVSASLPINKTLTIRTGGNTEKASISYTGDPNTPMFEMKPKGQLTLERTHIEGNKNNYAFASLKKDMSSLYNLYVEDCEIDNFYYVLKAYKYSFAEHINFTSTRIKNCNNGLELSEEIEDKGEYNAENITISNCYFDAIGKNVIDYYRGGYDESTVGGNLCIVESTFTNCGAKEKSGILINTYGIINVDISGNNFLNNKVKLVALLWGAKNNRHADNTIKNSGNILVEENLKLNLLY